MACVNLKHYCRVCKKGFMCGRALGGHMRAHGIGDEEDNASEWEERSNRSKQLRSNPNRLKSCRTCENCGKEFLSWKSFLEHGNGRCTSDESLLSSDEGGGGAWSKRKRSLRSKVMTSSEEDDLLLATCLVQLANTAVDLDAASESSASPPKGRAKVAPRGLFECKACKKVFTSHQALGGHRASHKKVKGCFAAKQDDPDDFPFEQAQLPLVGAARRKSKVHECSICHRVFNSGQALGGHKRCHWIISNSPETSSVPKFQFQDHHHHNKPGPADNLDLNVPAWAHISGLRRDPRNPLSFDVSTDIHPTWMGGNATHKAKAEANHVEDEADSKFKLAKFSDLSDANVGSSQWLQVGIGSTTTTAATTAEPASAAGAAAGDA